MMVEELGIQMDDGDASGPLRQGIVMFASFVTFGAVPLLAYIPNAQAPGRGGESHVLRHNNHSQELEHTGDWGGAGGGGFGSRKD